MRLGAYLKDMDFIFNHLFKSIPLYWDLVVISYHTRDPIQAWSIVMMFFVSPNLPIGVRNRVTINKLKSQFLFASLLRHHAFATALSLYPLSTIDDTQSTLRPLPISCCYSLCLLLVSLEVRPWLNYYLVFFVNHVRSREYLAIMPKVSDRDNLHVVGTANKRMAEVIRSFIGYTLGNRIKKST